MAIRFIVSYDKKVIDNALVRLSFIGRAMANKVRRNVRPTLNREAEFYFKYVPGPARYPIAWKSRKQKNAAIFRMKMLGNGPPYRRTGKINQRAKQRILIGVTQPDDKSIVLLLNYRTATSYKTGNGLIDYERFVRGPGIRQQQFHTITGWINWRVEEKRLMNIARPLIIEQWKTTRIFKGGEKVI